MSIVIRQRNKPKNIEPIKLQSLKACNYDSYLGKNTNQFHLQLLQTVIDGIL